ncbi:LIM/homeobox protein Lhx9-like [Amphiura filiformis]|uniref:LIM/homeobox protein Lhx9-like n=1 Tax=Amphiura filiformis TaxID=82378 RepID=UPI003B21458A
MPTIHGELHPQESTMAQLQQTSGSKPSMCAGCGERISDRFYLMAADRQWHNRCLRCCECKMQMDNALTCFAKDGEIYCKADYFRRFGVKRCARCDQGIAAHEMVMRARDMVFHLGCFTCATCNRSLVPGDYFGMREGLVYCRIDYDALLMQCGAGVGVGGGHFQNGDEHSPLSGFAPSYGNGPMTPGGSPLAGGVPYYNGVGGVQKGRPRKRKNHDLRAVDFCAGMGLDGHPLDGDFTGHGQQARTKRMRTSFKHHQLRTMKSYFSINHNPDAKDLKQLAQKTGLTKRVLQVWFQNARAKYRRSLLKKDQGDDKTKSDQTDNATDSHGSEANSPPDDDSTHLDGMAESDMGSPGPDIDNSDIGSEQAMSPDMDDSPSYSDLKSASPALADEVSTISSMPTGVSSHLSNNLSPIPKMTSLTSSTGFTPIFN